MHLTHGTTKSRTFDIGRDQVLCLWHRIFCNVSASNMLFSLPVALRTFPKGATNLAIQKIQFCMKKPLCCRWVNGGLLGQGEQLLIRRVLTSTCHFKEKWKDVDGQRSTTRIKSLLQAIGCSRKVGGKEKKKRNRKKQKGKRNDWSSVFDSFGLYISFAISV